MRGPAQLTDQRPQAPRCFVPSTNPCEDDEVTSGSSRVLSQPRAGTTEEIPVWPCLWFHPHGPHSQGPGPAAGGTSTGGHRWSPFG